ncbi:hypothetical protein SDC9_204641 [bioreactor metagenome]|uniref:Uncharacterized protein n=1 Tax=bioreactor metagenome TaxID=1076179 RepID=A0A645IZV1_9ZZZZ
MKRPVDPVTQHPGQFLYLRVNIPGRHGEGLAAAAQLFLVKFRHPGLFQKVCRQRGRVHHRGNSHGKDRHAQGLLVQRRTLISHAGAGDDSAVAELDGGTDAARSPGSQRIHGDDKIRLYLFYQSPHRLGGFHPRGS